MKQVFIVKHPTVYKFVSSLTDSSGLLLKLASKHIRVFLQPAPCLAPCLVNFSLYKYGAIRSSAPFHLVNLTRSYTELTRSRPQIAPCLAPYGSVFSSVLGKSDKIFKIWKKSKRSKTASIANFT